VAVASKWLILLLLVALGLWPSPCCSGWQCWPDLDSAGGWPWMKDWLSSRLRGWSCLRCP
jgi:hypothetical protein